MKSRTNQVVVLLLLALFGWVATTRYQTAQAQREGAPAAHRYSVVETEGHNLIVTDNQSETLYFYTIDKEKEVGSDLKLRGSVDLKQVGKPVIKLAKPKE
jgi:hypothetical protein